MAALVQLNDPDPILWVSLYITPAIISTLALVKPALKDSRIVKTTVYILKIVCIGLVVYLCSTLWILFQSQNDLKLELEFFTKILDYEEGRELGGTLLVVIWASTFPLNRQVL
ncbi:hypothetical protein CHUAL_006576 [Chamberlinius hualienensis]